MDTVTLNTVTLNTVTLISPDPDRQVADRLEVPISAEFAARYRLERLLGAGGTSTVYLATDLLCGGPVAIKILTRGSGLERARFLREAEYLQRVDHVNVVTLRECALDGRHPYLVMEFAAGGTLRRLLRGQGRLPVAQAVEIASDMLSGLEAMHVQGLVHRDLKPDNVLLDSAGRARIGDLGIAYDVARGEETCYEPGSLVGTPRYMAPEQALGQTPGPSADLYAVGLILFEMLSGEPPFPGTGADDLLRQHVHDAPPSILERVPWLPAPLAQLIARVLSKRTHDRPATAAVFRQMLAQCRPSNAPAISRPTYRLAIDREVLSRAQKATGSAVALLYHEYAALVRAYLLRATGPMGLRERTLAVFRIAGGHIPRLDAPVSFAHLLLRIAAHVADAIPS